MSIAPFSTSVEEKLLFDHLDLEALVNRNIILVSPGPENIKKNVKQISIVITPLRQL